MDYFFLLTGAFKWVTPALFFGTLKTELVHGERYRSRLEARLSIFEYVEVFYNRQRSQSALGYRSPEQYEKLLNET